MWYYYYYCCCYYCYHYWYYCYCCYYYSGEGYHAADTLDDLDEEGRPVARRSGEYLCGAVTREVRN